MPNHLTELNQRRQQLEMSCPALAARSGVPLATVNRVLRGGVGARFEYVVKIAEALGCPLALQATAIDRWREQQARSKAETLVKLTQGNSALEGQAITDPALRARMVERTVHRLLAGSGRRLWAR